MDWDEHRHKHFACPTQSDAAEDLHREQARWRVRPPTLAALGYHELQLNGAKVGDHVWTRPGRDMIIKPTMSHTM